MVPRRLATTVLLVLLIHEAAVGESPAPHASFPGHTGVGSPVSSDRVDYRDLGTDSNGLHSFALILRSKQTGERYLGTFGRSADVTWAPDGKSLFIDDHVGSNFADCYVVDLRSSKVAGRSITKRGMKVRGHPPRSEAKGHFYASCLGWRTGSIVFGAVSGHTDSPPFHSFCHPFAYRVQQRQVRWTRDREPCRVALPS